MARVVQRRTPPYLLIVFVMLFVFATVIAVLFFNKYTGIQEKYRAVLTQRKQLANNEQLKRAEIKQMMSKFTKSQQRPRPTVVAQLNEQISKLATAVTGLPNTTFPEAEQEIDKTFKAVNPPVRRGLVKHMTDFHKQLDVKDAEITKLQGEKQKFAADLAKAKQDLADATTEFGTKLDEKGKQIASLDQKFQNFETEHNAKLVEAKKEYAASVAEMSKQIADQATKVQTLERQVAKVTKKLQIEMGKKVRPSVDTARIFRRPDGRVRTVQSEANLVYVNIGSKDRVTEGLRLTVYPYTGIPPSGAGKAVIEVTNVSDNVSECRIIEQSKDKPVVPGDLVANVVFDALRTYSFVVEGQFDLDNAGAPTMAGNKAIKDLVRRYGGQIVKEVSIDSDYVILGDPPARPRKPDDTDPTDAWDLYQERLKSFNRYQEVKRQAESMQIPRLGGKRFLDLIGYIPTKVAKSD